MSLQNHEVKIILLNIYADHWIITFFSVWYASAVLESLLCSFRRLFFFLFFVVLLFPEPAIS